MKKPTIFLVALPFLFSGCSLTSEYTPVPRDQNYVIFRMTSDRGKICDFHPICTDPNQCDLKPNFNLQIYSKAFSRLSADQRIAVQKLFFVQNGISHPWICGFAPSGPGMVYSEGAINRCVQGSLVPGPVRIVMTGHVEQYNILGAWIKTEAKILSQIYSAVVRPMEYPIPCSSN
jgi:hypothetical protein